MAQLKKTHVDEMKAFKETLKGKNPKEKKAAVEAKKAEQKAAVKELEKTNKAEMEQFRKDHPRTHNKDKKHEGKKEEAKK